MMEGKGKFISIGKIVFMLILAIASIGTVGCKSQKKLAKEAAAKEAEAKALQIQKAKDALNEVINDNGQMSIEEKENVVARVKAMQLNDPEINELIRTAEDKIAEEKAALEEASMDEEEEAIDAGTRLNQYFNAIANASSVAGANNNINEALNMFSSPEALVLIIISKSGDQKDYDRPTTIRKYLEYVKDQKKNINAIDNIVFDSQGKIKELELIKK